jgi:hypothetical protein
VTDLKYVTVAAPDQQMADSVRDLIVGRRFAIEATHFKEKNCPMVGALMTEDSAIAFGAAADEQFGKAVQIRIKPQAITVHKSSISTASHRAKHLRSPT